MTGKNFIERIIELHSKLAEMRKLRTEFQFPKIRKEEDVEHEYKEDKYRST